MEICSYYFFGLCKEKECGKIEGRVIQKKGCNKTFYYTELINEDGSNDVIDTINAFKFIKKESEKEITVYSSTISYSTTASTTFVFH